MTRTPRCRVGVTLVELVVVLAVVGTVLAVTGVSLSRVSPPSERQEALASIARLRTDALRARAPLRTVVRVSGTSFSVLAMPDGSIRVDASLGIDQLTGRPDAARP